MQMMMKTCNSQREMTVGEETIMRKRSLPTMQPLKIGATVVVAMQEAMAEVTTEAVAAAEAAAVIMM
jgi:hypothetical protein